MDASIKSLLEASWRQTREEFLGIIHHTISELEDLLSLENYHRHGHDTAHLKEALGPFGATNMDLNALSSVLGEGDKTRFMTEERSERIQQLLKQLKDAHDSFKANPPCCAVAGIEENEEDIHAAAEEHLNNLAGLFKNLRIAQLEIKAKYQPQRHDAIFLDFNWRHLSPAETSICPPFIVYAAMEDNDTFVLRKMMSLLTSRKPIKILALRSSMKKQYPSAASGPGVPATMDIEMFPIAMRGVYALQTSPADPKFADNLSAALTAPRPGVLSLFWKTGNEDDDSFLIRAERALLSRTFPNFVYDPDVSMDFVNCFDLSGNPDIEQEWGRQKVAYIDDIGNAQEMERNFTFANFASEESEFDGGFADIPDDAAPELVIPLSEFLSMTRQQRIGKIPYVTVLNKKQHLVKQVPSQDIITQTSDRMHLWRTLKEFAGVDNPHVHEAKTALRSELDAKQQTELETLRKEMEAQAVRREKTAMAVAVRNLTARLTGVTPDQIPLGNLLSMALPPAASEIEEASEQTEEDDPLPKKAMATGTGQALPEGPWIETQLCTACDECITINDRIFKYNEDKKAVIKDARGGPYKDIVRAAEKCSAEIIHPGEPLDPSEKDADKWVKRAEKFN